MVIRPREVASDQVVERDALKRAVVLAHGVPKVSPKAGESGPVQTVHKGGDPIARRRVHAVRRRAHAVRPSLPVVHPLPLVPRPTKSMISGSACSRKRRWNRPTADRSRGIQRLPLKIDGRIRISPNRTRSIWRMRALSQRNNRAGIGASAPSPSPSSSTAFKKGRPGQPIEQQEREETTDEGQIEDERSDEFLSEDDEVESEEPAGERELSENRPPRRRRRRRRRPGERGPRREPSSEEPLTDVEAEEAFPSESPLGISPATDDEEESADIEGDLEGEDDEAPRVYRNVPTWEEAISYLLHRRPNESRSREGDSGALASTVATAGVVPTGASARKISGGTPP